jgi:hypothetical protein
MQHERVKYDTVQGKLRPPIDFHRYMVWEPTDIGTLLQTEDRWGEDGEAVYMFFSHQDGALSSRLVKLLHKDKD